MPAGCEGDDRLDAVIAGDDDKAGRSQRHGIILRSPAAPYGVTPASCCGSAAPNGSNPSASQCRTTSCACAVVTGAALSDDKAGSMSRHTASSLHNRGAAGSEIRRELAHIVISLP